MKNLHLPGVEPEALGNYLMGLGVVRALSAVDPLVKARWSRSDTLYLKTCADPIAHLCERHRFTPIGSPWNGGSGFYAGSGTKAAVGYLDVIARSEADRLEVFRRTIATARALVGKQKPAAGEEKKALFARCRAELPDEARPWLDAVGCIKPDGELYFSPFLGSGGNEGRFDWGATYAGLLPLVVDVNSGRPTQHSEYWLRGALFGEPYRCDLDVSAKALWPGAIAITPWHIILALEGMCFLAISPERAERPAHSLRAPCTASTVGVTTTEKGRAEFWMPLWRRAASVSRIQEHLDTTWPARGTRRALVVAKLSGQDDVPIRSIFARFGYLERNGLSCYSVPLGHCTVAHTAYHQALGAIDSWTSTIASVGRGLSGKHPGSPLVFLTGQVEKLLLDVAKPKAPRATWERFLISLGELERFVCEHGSIFSKAGVPPSVLPPLPRAWFEHIDDGSAEVRIAAAIASQWGFVRGGVAFPAIRSYFRPHDPRKRRRLHTRVLGFGRYVAHGVDLVDNLVAIVLRAWGEGYAANRTTLALHGRRYATLDDVSAFILGHVNDARISALLRPLMAMRPFRFGQSVPCEGHVPRLLAPFRLLYPGHAGSPSGKAWMTGADRAPLELLCHGRLAEATDAAKQRLVASALPTKGMGPATGSATLARRIAASLAIPLAWSDLETMQRMIAGEVHEPFCATA